MVRKSTLDNGLRIITEQIPVVHSVALGVWVATGSRHEQAPRQGISHFLEHMIFKGTERRSARDIAREIDAVGGVLNAFTSREYCCFYAKSLDRNLPLITDLLGDIVMHSRLDLDEIEKERRVVMSEIAMIEDTPDDQVHDLFCRTFWQDHPLGAPVVGTEASVADIDRAALSAYMAEHYRAGNLVVTAAGNLDHDDVVTSIDAVLGALPPGEADTAAWQPEYGRNVDVRDKELEQVQICLGTRGLSQSHPDRFALYCLNALLGGSMSSRLFQSVREERGLAYSIYSYLHNHTDAGALAVCASTAPADTYAVVTLILEEFARLRRDMVTPGELLAVREQLKGNLLLSLESTENRMTRLARNEIYLGGDLPIESVLAEIDAVTADDILSLAEEILVDEYLNLQLLGRAEEADFTRLDLTVGA